MCGPGPQEGACEGGPGPLEGVCVGGPGPQVWADPVRGVWADPVRNVWADPVRGVWEMGRDPRDPRWSVAFRPLPVGGRHPGRRTAYVGGVAGTGTSPIEWVPDPSGVGGWPDGRCEWGGTSAVAVSEWGCCALIGDVSRRDGVSAVPTRESHACVLETLGRGPQGRCAQTLLDDRLSALDFG